MAYLVAALGLGWFAARPRQGWPGLVCGGRLPQPHSLIHVADAIGGPICGQHLLRELPVLLAALIGAGIAALSISTEGNCYAEGHPAPLHL